MSDNGLDAEDFSENKSPDLLEAAFHWRVVRKVTTDILNKLRHGDRCYEEQ